MLRALLPMACDGVGPSYTCVSLLRGMRAAGLDCDVTVNRSRIALNDLPHCSVVPGPLSLLPYPVVSGIASRLAERRFLRFLRAGDIAYLWPGVSLKVHHHAAALGVPVVMEGINTRMASARAILDRAYEGLGLTPAHGITDARIAEEEEKLACANAIFAPSPGVEAALVGLPSDCAVVPTSYGVGLDLHAPVRARFEAPLRVLSVGYLCVRKGLHLLLSAWDRAGIDGELVLVGAVEKAIARKYADVLNRPDVRLMGFHRDVAAFYNTTDLFVQASLEEGDPLVTYEAAAHALPLIASPMGAGRLGAETGCTIMIDPAEPESLVEALRWLARDHEARAEWGARAARAVQDYEWRMVGARRASLLFRIFGRPSQ